MKIELEYAQFLTASEIEKLGKNPRDQERMSG